MNRPRISVLMPVLDEEASVAGAIASALAQADQGVDLEVLVMNGPSTDATAEIVAGLAAGDPRVRLLDNPERNIPAGLNIGLAAARGEFVARIDGHASVSPDYLARALRHLEADPGLAAVGGIRHGVARTPQGRAVALALSSPFGVGNSINHFGREFRETDHASFGVYRTEVARRVNGWDETLLVNEDVDFDHRILGLGYRIAFDPEMHIYWHVRESVPDLFHQYRRYGRGKAAMVRKNGRDAIRARHLAAPVAVAGTAGLGVLATRFPRLAAAAYSPYLFGIGAASAHAWRGRRETQVEPGAPEDRTVSAAALPGAFLAMHYGWGLGFLEGYLLRKSPARASARTRR
ncbi:glycosyltransferase family 2 protein [Mobilicoccus pelagius]|uniref:Putative glycosyltransferase n=1 Tax=Mobilicoccus pelagius NBRC 104925 TaxID=1089455 RepID=H5UMW2_9MICO|nr:glycosyltransferase family 2 protein [Mobilicoccus pelagius]GAB47070.1 putative glycosyltransferase [Mobilicoccus pelagius NBRC 104925]